MPDEAANINLRLALDRAALQQSQDGVTALDKKLSDLKTHVATTGATADKSIRSLADAFRTSNSSIDASTKAVQALRSQLQGAASDSAKLSTTSVSIQGLRRTGGALSQLGAGEVGGLVSRIGDIGQIGQEVSSLIEALGPLAPLLAGVAGGVIGLQIGLKLLDRQLEDSKRGLQSALDTQKDYYQFAATATTEDAQRRKRELENTARYQQQAVDETERVLKSLEQQTNIARDVGATLPGALGDPFRQLIKQLDDAKKAVGDTNAAIGRLEGGLKSAAFAANDARQKIEDFFKNAKVQADRISKEIEDRNTRVASVQKKYEDDAARIEEQAQARRADIEKRYADRLVQIAQQAADAASSALERLTEKRQDLLTGLNRDLDKEQRAAATKQLDIQINAGREEVKALREHAREVEQIRKDASARETSFLLDRNFRALYESRLQTSRDIERSNDQFTASRQDRQSALQDQFGDLTRSIQRERAERLIAYQQQLADAQTAYRRELQQAQQKRTAELAQARQEEQAALAAASAAATNELRIRKAAYDKELQLVSLYGSAYVKASDQIQQALINRAEQRLAQITGASGGSTGGGSGNSIGGSIIGLVQGASQTAGGGASLPGSSSVGGFVRGFIQAASGRAGGGPLAKGQASMVNERGRESFNGAPFPPGLGLFVPAKAGSVAQARDGVNVTQHIYPSPGMNEEALAHKALDLLEKVLG